MDMSKKDQIIKTAIKLFVKQGFENTPTSQISKESKVATGTLFHHFKTKNDLISEAYLEAKIELFEEIKKNLDEKDSVELQMKKMFTNCILWGLKNPEKMKFILQFISSPHISSITRKKIEDNEAYFYNFVKQGIKEKKIKDLPIEYILDNAFNQMTSTVNYLLLTKSKDKKLIEKMVSSMIDFMT